ncbi:hypothetical protein RB195_025151 [Necator americanus]|uniref:Uncharacterized protein n=1 Tax=Necator americanus TaxID=51031 RepID=A0ABR1ER70_NECAM
MRKTKDIERLERKHFSPVSYRASQQNEKKSVLGKPLAERALGATLQCGLFGLFVCLFNCADYFALMYESFKNSPELWEFLFFSVKARWTYVRFCSNFLLFVSEFVGPC